MGGQWVRWDFTENKQVMVKHVDVLGASKNIEKPYLKALNISLQLVGESLPPSCVHSFFHLMLQTGFMSNKQVNAI